jgi:hypothetical protein
MLLARTAGLDAFHDPSCDIYNYTSCDGSYDQSCDGSDIKTALVLMINAAIAPKIKAVTLQ